MQYMEEEQFESRPAGMSVWKRLVAYALRYPKVVASDLCAMTLSSLCDIAYPLMTRYAIDHFITKGTAEGIVPFALAYFLLVAAQGGTVFWFIERTGRLEMDISYDIRQDGFVRLQQLTFSFFDRTPVGYLLARMVADVSRLSEMIAWGMIDLCWGVMYIIGALITMFILNVPLTLAAIGVIPVLAVLSGYFQTRILRQQREVRRANSRITGAFNEGITGAATTKTLVREEQNLQEFTVLTGNMRRASVKSAVLSALYMPLVLSIGSMATAAAIVLGGNMTVAGTIGLGTLAAFISYTTQLFEPIQSLARILAEYQSAQASAERVLSLIDTKPDIVESDEVVEVYGDNFRPKRENWPAITGDITFENVSFRYKEGEQVLEGFNLHVSAGQTIALVGETGAGKSTIVNLVCRFYEPTEGRVLIDGADYRTRSSLWLEESLGYVLQSPHLFSGTIADNIRYARRNASMEEVEQAAKLACAHDFIKNLPDGYGTEVGEGGGLLSTGQKQLVSFARVILADPRIFVLDEATSSIDTETEQLIQRAIVRVLQGRTSFIVAHRLSTIRSADRILVIDAGRILEDGTHAELLARRGRYFDLYTNQFSQQEVFDE